MASSEVYTINNSIAGDLTRGSDKRIYLAGMKERGNSRKSQDYYITFQGLRYENLEAFKEKTIKFILTAI